MKGLCYIVLIIGFFIFYQQNPLYAIIIIVIFLGVYIIFKSRSSGNSSILNFLSGRNPQQDSKIDDLITLMMLQQLLTSNPQHHDTRDSTENKDEIEKTKQEVLNLLEED